MMAGRGLFMSRKLVLAGLALCGLAMLVRTYHIENSKTVPTSWHLVGDAKGYYDWSQFIAAGDWMGNEPFYQAPLFPYTLAVITKVIGPDPNRMLYVQAIWGTLAVLLIYLATARLFGLMAGCLAGVMYALYPPAIFFDGILQKASLAGFLVCALIYLLTLRNSVISYVRAISLGLVLGLLCLTRENAFSWWPFILIWIIVESLRGRHAGENHLEENSESCSRRKSNALESPRGLKPAARERRTSLLMLVVLFLFGMMLVLGPVALRNRKVGGAWTLSTFQAGPNFYIGNGNSADGYYRPLVRGHETPQFERADATLLAERAEGRALSSREVSSYWMARVWSEISESPGRWVKLMGRKLLMAVHRYEVADVESLAVYSAASPVIGVIGSIWHFGVLATLAAMGLMLTRSRWRELWIYYVMIAVMILAVAAFFILARYRFVLVPLMIPFAAIGLVETVRRVRAGRVMSLWGAGLAGVVVAGVCHWPMHDEARLDALAFMNAGVAAAEAGQLAEATPYLAYAVEIHPSSMEAQNNLAQALSLQGRFDEAVGHYEAALVSARIDIEPGGPEATSLRARFGKKEDASLPVPMDVEGHGVEPGVLAGIEYNYGVALERVGQSSEALAAFERAVVLRPGDDGARAAVERLSAKLRGE